MKARDPLPILFGILFLVETIYAVVEFFCCGCFCFIEIIIKCFCFLRECFIIILDFCLFSRSQVVACSFDFLNCVIPSALSASPPPGMNCTPWSMLRRKTFSARSAASHAGASACPGHCTNGRAADMALHRPNLPPGLPGGRFLRLFPLVFWSQARRGRRG